MKIRANSARRSLNFSAIYAAIAGSLVWLSLGLQFYLLTAKTIENGSGLWVGIARYFGYFTILTNILVALVWTVPLLIGRSRWRKYLTRSSVRTAAAAYIAIVGLGYSLLLRHLWNPEGWQLVADRMLHDFTPIAYVLFWFLFVPKGDLRWRDLRSWLVYPLVYLTIALLRGAIFGWYPYPFLEANNLGYVQVFLNSGMLLIGFLVVSSLLIGIGRLTGRTD
ncbi:Pr6Pr family membrane protein [Microcoleus sp. FACHB-1515]|uniref:Pr6Pr family membrane protein n=1 Tax=Cyanophyceae TaxID=3028117 RepID=UPI001683FA3C|nr:Pr6Pr family membrane protein [Microcoleus sp. FACHB-1515]MBD2091563.1 Pr6Pr family membrane protein [Microcoleus sp. FACHB-1515]